MYVLDIDQFVSFLETKDIGYIYKNVLVGEVGIDYKIARF